MPPKPNPPAPPAPKKAARQTGCLTLLGYAYGVFVLAVAGVVVYFHYKKAEHAPQVMSRIADSAIATFIEKYDLEHDPDLAAEIERVKVDEPTWTPTKIASHRDKKIEEFREARRDTLKKLRDDLVAAEKDGRIDKPGVEKLRRIFDWVEEANAGPKTTHDQFEKLRGDLESLLSELPAKTPES